MKKLAIVLFNLGGPDGSDSVRPFLFNLFNDKAIIDLPAPFRWMLARLISTTRAPSAKKNYALMGGGSPLLPETQKQADALEQALVEPMTRQGVEAKCFIAMRYWKPFTDECVQAVRDWGADEVLLLPLYPQFSTTTTGSSLKAWAKAYGDGCKIICCYPFAEGVIDAHRTKIIETFEASGKPDKLTLILSAHGLPKKIVEKGDPYQWQVEEMSKKISQGLPEEWNIITAYQSRVGPLEWIGPSTDDVIEDAAKRGRHIMITPIAFVSEHIETLVELDVEYRELAEEHGAAGYSRVPALGVDETFIHQLRDIVMDLNQVKSCSAKNNGICPKEWGNCPHRSSYWQDQHALNAWPVK